MIYPPKLLLILLIFFGIKDAQSQQQTQYSLYMYNKYKFNVAYGGFDDYLSITGVFRKQWVGLEGSPMTQNLSAHLPWNYLNSGIGINIENDQLGAEQNLAINLSYNYISQLSKESKLSIGIGGSLLQKTIDGTLLRAPDGNYEGPTLTHNDDYIPSNKVSAFAPDLSLAVYYSMKRFEVGVSANNLLESKLSYELDAITELKYFRNYTLLMNYNIGIGPKFEIEPSIFLKSDIVQTQSDVSVVLTYNNSFFGGMSLRGYNNSTLDAVIFLAGMKYKENITVAYSYDLSLSTLKTVNRGSHEIVVNYNLNKDLGSEIPAKVIYNPRHF